MVSKVCKTGQMQWPYSSDSMTYNIVNLDKDVGFLGDGFTVNCVNLCEKTWWFFTTRNPVRMWTQLDQKRCFKWLGKKIHQHPPLGFVVFFQDASQWPPGLITCLKHRGTPRSLNLHGCHDGMASWEFRPHPTYTGWWFEIVFIFTPIWGRFSIWLIFFQMGWNHQLV